MTNEHILRWLMELGSNWLTVTQLSNTWADYDIYWHDEIRAGLLEEKKVWKGERLTYQYKLTPKAIDSLMK